MSASDAAHPWMHVYTGGSLWKFELLEPMRVVSRLFEDDLGGTKHPGYHDKWGSVLRPDYGFVFTHTHCTVTAVFQRRSGIFSSDTRSQYNVIDGSRDSRMADISICHMSHINNSFFTRTIHSPDNTHSTLFRIFVDAPGQQMTPSSNKP
jgi:hypothetical protein